MNWVLIFLAIPLGIASGGQGRTDSQCESGLRSCEKGEDRPKPIRVYRTPFSTAGFRNGQASQGNLTHNLAVLNCVYFP